MPIIWIKYKQILVMYTFSFYLLSLIIWIVSLIYKENELSINNLINVIPIEKKKTKGCRRKQRAYKKDL